MRYAFFIGCTTPVRALNYELSTRKVAEKLGVELVDVPEFSCCGFPLKALSDERALAIAVNNLAIAEEKGLDVCTVCSACASFLTEANRQFKENKAFRKIAENILKELGRTYSGKVVVKHFARVLYEDVGIEKIRKNIKKPLALNVAVHYGCHYLKPSRIYKKFDDPEAPKTLDELVAVTGAKSVDYGKKKQCCGGGILGINEQIALTLSKEKLDDVKNSKADAMVLICPFCSIMYDVNQRKIESNFETEYRIPVLYYPQLLGLALGLKKEELSFDINRVKVDSLLERLK